MGKLSKPTNTKAKVTKRSSDSGLPAAKKGRAAFPIVGIGSSAGGLEALELFFTQMPQKNGMAFVIVQHLDPDHKGMMVELLQRRTRMPVVEIKDRMKVEPEHVYVIPPNQDLSILHGRLHLLEPSAPRGLRLPIDFFLNSLAVDQQELGIAVILSGMGSDGSQALRAIKEKSGAVFVQDPVTAKFDGMPRSAIDSGLADIVAPVEELPGRIFSYQQNIPQFIPLSDTDLPDREQSGLEKVIFLLRAQTGHDFSLYKKNTMYRRIERRMGLHQLPKIADYVRYLRENPQEATLLFKELLIGVTNFFRDAEVWEQLKTEVIPKLLADRPEGGVLRAWTTGCSTGEEAYTLAMVFCEALEQLKPQAEYSLQIFATDLDTEAIDKARAGVYPASILADVSEERLQRFFVQEEQTYRVSKKIREMIIFAPQNLIMDPPFTKLDLLTCRNLLIYLQTELQKKIFRLFHYSLNPNGILVLGSAETVGQSSDLFTALAGKTRLYRRKNTSKLPELIGFPAAFSRRTPDSIVTAQPQSSALQPVPNLKTLTDSLLLCHYTPAAVLTTAEGDILYITGKTGKYLEPAVGKANLNLFAMAREGLGNPLHDAFFSAHKESKTVTLKGIRVGTNGGSQLVDVSVDPVTEPEELCGMMLVVFTDIATPAATSPSGQSKSAAKDARVADLVLKLQQSREELQAVREEKQSSQEELKSANEELQSTNEELQSTNEELTTSKEEIQSMNEELQTVNQELQARVDELSMVSDDMKNLLNSTEIATLFLDGNLKVRRFTPQITSIIKLIPGDLGRNFTDIVSTLDYPDLADNARTVLQSLVPIERQVSTSDDCWFEVRIMPYRTQNNHIDGVVITFIDVTQTKNQEQALAEALSVLKGRYDEQSEQLSKSQRSEAAAIKAQAVLEEVITKQNQAQGKR